MAIAGLILFLLGLIFVIVAPINKRKNNLRSAQAEGTLMNIFERDNSSGGGGLGFVYSYFVNEIEYQLTSSASSSQTKNIGDRCTIWYNPAKPKDAQPFHYNSNKIYNIILIIGIIMILLGLLLPILSIAASTVCN